MVLDSETKGKSTILIVDDEKSIVDTLGAVLSIRGYDVLEAYSGEKASALIKEYGPPDLIVLDVLLPGMNGLDLCKQMKADPLLKNIPILMITVITRQSEVSDGFWNIGAGADDFVTKPFDPFDIADRIERLLARFQKSSGSRC